jgi:hypothetical protein
MTESKNRDDYFPPADDNLEQPGVSDTLAELSPRQYNVLQALLETGDTGAAAKAAGVHIKTVQRYLQDDTFARAYRALRNIALAETTAALQQQARTAVETMGAAMSEDVSDMRVRLQGARGTLDYLVKLTELESRVRELDEIELRLAELERAIEGDY